MVLCLGILISGSFSMQSDVWTRYMRNADKEASRYTFISGTELSN